jgi:hypothetical protein
MHLRTSDSEYEFANDESISSIAFPSFHSLHAYATHWITKIKLKQNNDDK